MSIEQDALVGRWFGEQVNPKELRFAVRGAGILRPDAVSWEMHPSRSFLDALKTATADEEEGVYATLQARHVMYTADDATLIHDTLSHIADWRVNKLPYMKKIDTLHRSEPLFLSLFATSAGVYVDIEESLFPLTYRQHTVRSCELPFLHAETNVFSYPVTEWRNQVEAAPHIFARTETGVWRFDIASTQ